MARLIDSYVNRVLQLHTWDLFGEGKPGIFNLEFRWSTARSSVGNNLRSRLIRSSGIELLSFFIYILPSPKQSLDRSSSRSLSGRVIGGTLLSLYLISFFFSFHSYLCSSFPSSLIVEFFFFFSFMKKKYLFFFIMDSNSTRENSTKNKGKKQFAEAKTY